MDPLDPASLCKTMREGLASLFECAPAPRGVRVRTPFLYPDGGVVDVFVVQDGDWLRVTDHGEALSWLRTQSVAGRLSPKQRALVEDVRFTLGVERFKGQLFLRTNDPKTLSQDVLRLAQAIVRVSDLWFTFRTRAVESIADEVSAWLTEREIPFDSGVRQLGRSGRSWTVDFHTSTPDRSAFVFLLSTGSRAAARRITEHVVAGFHDLSHLKLVQPHLAFVSLFDDTGDVWEVEDFKLVEDLSEVARWSRPDELERLLRAA